ncbi:MAG: hypothetical protein K2W96_19380 [Gemmataceae bacterium]|nr:hypothetical protein [Gemmataceae bacterium]
MFTIPMPWPDSSLLLSPPWPHLAPWLRWPLLAALVLVPVLLLRALYRYELRLVRPSTAFGLLALRLAAILVVLFLVCLQPIHAHERRFPLPGRVIVAVDRSLSLSIADPQRPPPDKIRLAKALGLAKGVPASWLDAEPRWLTDAEGALDISKQQELAAERRKGYEELCAKVDALTRAEIARLVLDKAGLGLLDALGAKHAVELWGFDRDLRELKPDQLDELFRAPEGEALAAAGFTDLSAPLSRAAGGELLGIVLLTDGQHNSGPAPGDAARRLGQRKTPVFAVALGEPTSPPDAAIVSVRSASQNFYKDVEGVIDVKARLAGLEAGEYMVELLDEAGKEAAPPRTIQHDGKDRTYPLSFGVKLDKVGARTLTAHVKPPARDAVPANNRRSALVNVADDRARVLLADGEARWEYHYLATALERDRLVELKKIVFDQPRLEEIGAEEAEKLGLPARAWPKGDESFGDLGCVILGDVDAANLTLPDRVKLERFVSEAGGTLVIVAGKRAMPLGFPDDDPLRRLLPIESPHVLDQEEGFSLTLTRAGEEQKFLELEADRGENATLWAGHPRPWGWAVAGTAKPGAVPLLSWLDPKDEKLPPSERERKNVVMARHNYGFGRVLYVGLDSTWRLRFKVGDLYHHRLWGQIVRWAAGDRPLTAGNEHVRFGTAQPAARPGEAVDITVRLSEKAGPLKPDLLAGARIIRLPEAGEKEKAVALVPLARAAGRPRLLEGRISGLPPGRYAVELAIPDLEAKLKDGEKPLRAAFAVLDDETREMIALETNRALLDDLAASSGGRVFLAHEAGELRDLVAAKTRTLVERHDQKLYQWWGMLALVVALLTLEWAARKWAGLP